MYLKPNTPTVTLSTKNLGEKIEIRISDNGPGIPDAITEKIFQPFFTTILIARDNRAGHGFGIVLKL